MHTKLPAQIRRLTLCCYRDAVARSFPGYENAKGYSRDRKTLASLSDQELLTGLPRLGKLIDQRIATSDQLDVQADVTVVFPTHPSLFSGLPGEAKDIVRCLRQVCYLFSKVQLSAEIDGVDEAVASFLQRNQHASRAISGCELTYRAMMSATSILGSIDWLDIRPKHGPGAVATREKPWEKFVFKRIYSRLEGYYPFCDYMFLNYTHLCDKLHVLQNLEVLDEPISRMVAVPKDFRGPRLICAEPLELQWIQQGQRRVIEQAIETHPLTKGFINFGDQTVNQQLALKSSLDQTYVTFDLKDASDMISHNLARLCLPTRAFNYLNASRSSIVRLPDGSQVPMNIFSPMGSAVCFPIESLVFFTIAQAAIASAERRPLEWRRNDDVYVFGDDLVVKSSKALPVAQALSSLGIKLNEQKCCIASHFRESCGGDFYSGMDVSPVRIKKLPNRSDPSSLASVTDCINNLSRKSLTTTAREFRVWCEAEFGRLPMSTDVTQPAIHCRSRYMAVDNNQFFRSRWNKKFQRREWLIKVVEPVFKRVVEPAWCEVFASIQMGTRKSDRGFPVPHRGRLVTRWTAL